MTAPRRGELRGFDPTAFPFDAPPADGLVILTEDDWNAQMRSSTVVPVNNADQHPAPGDPTIVDLGQGTYADCSAMFPVLHAQVGDLWQPPLSQQELRLIEDGARRHLCLHQLQAQLPEPPIPQAGVAAPRQGAVRQADWPPGDPHMIAVISASDSNARLGTCTGVLLTSKTKTARARWEVPVPGGCTVVGDVITFDNDDLRASTQAGRPNQLSPATLANIAQRLANALAL